MTTTERTTSAALTLFVEPGTKQAILCFNGEMNREACDRTMLNVQHELPASTVLDWYWTTAETVTSSVLTLESDSSESAWNKVAVALGEHLKALVQVVTMETIRAYVNSMLTLDRAAMMHVLGWMAENMSDFFSKPDTA